MPAWVIALPLNTDIKQFLINTEVKPASNLSVSWCTLSLLWEVPPQQRNNLRHFQCQYLGSDGINKEKLILTYSHAEKGCFLLNLISRNYEQGIKMYRKPVEKLLYYCSNFKEVHSPPQNIHPGV